MKPPRSIPALQQTALNTPGKKEKVVQYFDAIGPRYDLADTLMSFGLDFFWRRTVLKHLAARKGDRVLDLCGGAGEFARRIAGTRTAETTVVCDLSRSMLAAGKRKSQKDTPRNPIHWVRSDAEHLGFGDHSFEAVIVGYGIRNLSDLSRGLQEMHRVLVPGGKLVIMEFSIPQSRWIKALYNGYSFWIMPGFGRLITGEDAPFVYLADSIRRFPPPDRVQEIIASAGFVRVTFHPLSNGLVTVYCATKSPDRVMHCA